MAKITSSSCVLVIVEFSVLYIIWEHVNYVTVLKIRPFSITLVIEEIMFVYHLRIRISL